MRPPEETPGRIRHILVADDGSDEAWRAVEVGTDLTRRYGARATVLTVIHHPAYPATVGEVQEADAEQREFAAGVQRKGVGYAAARGVELHAVVQAGHPVEAIVDYARAHGADLIVMGHRACRTCSAFSAAVCRTASSTMRRATC